MGQQQQQQWEQGQLWLLLLLLLWRLQKRGKCCQLGWVMARHLLLLALELQRQAVLWQLQLWERLQQQWQRCHPLTPLTLLLLLPSGAQALRQ